MVNKFHTIIFDLDGTLSDSAILSMTAFKNILPGYGLPVPSEEEIRRVTGHATPEFFYILFPGCKRDMIYNIGTLVEQEELRILPPLGEKLLFEGCRELLLKARECGLRLYIASTGARDHVYSILEATGIKGFFEKISCGRPDKTEMLRELTCEKTGGGGKNGFVMVGDMKKDHEGARSNGILSVGACYGYCKRELTDFDLYIDKPLDLLNVLKIKEG